jgi:hypothetical protein
MVSACLRAASDESACLSPKYSCDDLSSSTKVDLSSLPVLMITATAATAQSMRAAAPIRNLLCENYMAKSDACHEQHGGMGTLLKHETSRITMAMTVISWRKRPGQGKKHQRISICNFFVENSAQYQPSCGSGWRSGNLARILLAHGAVGSPWRYHR